MPLLHNDLLQHHIYPVKAEKKTLLLIYCLIYMKTYSKKDYIRNLAAFFCSLAVTLFFGHLFLGNKLINIDNGLRREFFKFERYDGSAQVLLNNSLSISPLAGGDDLKLKDLRGNFVVVNLWASWCAPCVEELPELQKLKDYLKGHEQDVNLRVLAVSVDMEGAEQSAARISKMLGDNSVASYYDKSGQLQQVLRADVLPTSFIISPSGHVLYKLTGQAKWSSKEVVDLLDAIMHAHS